VLPVPSAMRVGVLYVVRQVGGAAADDRLVTSSKGLRGRQQLRPTLYNNSHHNQHTHLVNKADRSPHTCRCRRLSTACCAAVGVCLSGKEMAGAMSPADVADTVAGRA
jgi:hypothetical protein